MVRTLTLVSSLAIAVGVLGADLASAGGVAPETKSPGVNTLVQQAQWWDGHRRRWRHCRYWRRECARRWDWGSWQFRRCLRRHGCGGWRDDD